MASATSRTGRRTVVIALIAALVVLAALAVIVIAQNALRPANTTASTVAHGRLSGKAWEMYASRTNGQLCLGIHEANGQQNEACGFSRQGGGGLFWAGQSDSERHFLYGPLPKSAAAVSVAPGVRAQIGMLPAELGYNGAKYWVYGFAGKAPSGLYRTPHVTDGAGNRIALQEFTN